MRFRFVSPGICLHLPSDSTSRWTPLVFGYILPAIGRIRDFHPLETCARKAHKNAAGNLFTGIPAADLQPMTGELLLLCLQHVAHHFIRLQPAPVFKAAHIAGGDFIDQQQFSFGIASILKFDVIEF